MPKTIGAAPPPSSPLPIPTTAARPATDTEIQGQMNVVGPCLTLVLDGSGVSQPFVLPIWPVGFSAKGGEGEGIVLEGSMPPSNDAINSERLELHGEYVDQPPADAEVAPECADYQLFLVGRASNIAK